jgi:DNA invertase Pin-like site-specific DNA recombinase
MAPRIAGFAPNSNRTLQFQSTQTGSLKKQINALRVVQGRLITRITELNDRKIGFKSLTENIDTTTSGGKLIFQIFGALAEFERDIIRERTNAGLEAARARGKLGGRPKALSSEKIKLARKLYADTSTSVAEICKMLGISRHTLQRYMKE